LKRFWSSALLYATAATGPTIPEATTVQLPSLSTFTNTDIDSLYDKIKERFPDMAPVVTHEDLEENYRQCKADITSIKSDVDSALSSLPRHGISQGNPPPTKHRHGGCQGAN
jgi:hypothetical protein